MKAGNLGLLLGGFLRTFKLRSEGEEMDQEKGEGFQAERSACPQHSCNRKQMGRFHGKEKGSLAGTECKRERF